MEAQPRPASVVGEYYLQGVMETASGFKLNSDSSFEFFFSYGALDREGRGTWKQEGNVILFTSNAKIAQDYTLVKTDKLASTGVFVRITGGNSQLYRFIQVLTSVNGKKERSQANSEGWIKLTAGGMDSIDLLFELCPDKNFSFTVKNRDLNYYEFRLEPSIMNIEFTDFRLEIHPDQLTGPHPLMIEKSFVYRKAGR